MGSTQKDFVEFVSQSKYSIGDCVYLCDPQTVPPSLEAVVYAPWNYKTDCARVIRRHIRGYSVNEKGEHCYLLSGGRHCPKELLFDTKNEAETAAEVIRTRTNTIITASEAFISTRDVAFNSPIDKQLLNGLLKSWNAPIWSSDEERDIWRRVTEDFVSSDFLKRCMHGIKICTLGALTDEDEVMDTNYPYCGALDHSQIEQNSINAILDNIIDWLIKESDRVADEAEIYGFTYDMTFSHPRLRKLDPYSKTYTWDKVTLYVLKKVWEVYKTIVQYNQLCTFYQDICSYFNIEVPPECRYKYNCPEALIALFDYAQKYKVYNPFK